MKTGKTQPKPLKKSEFADICGVDRGYMTRLCRARLAPAVDGKHIDAAHPVAVEFLKEHGVNPTRVGREAVKMPKPKKAEKAPDPGQDKIKVIDDAGNEFLVELEHLTLGQIWTRFGSTPGFMQYLDMAKKREDILEKQLKNQSTRSESIDRNLVRKHCFGYLEELSRRLLNDSAQTIANNVREAALSGETEENCIEIVLDLLSPQIQNAKDKMIRALDD